jgi:hypothetical protein
VILFAQPYDEITSGRLPGLRAGSGACGRKEDGFRIAAKVMAQDLKRSRRVIKVVRDFGGGPFVDEIGPQSLVHAVFGVGGFQKEAAAFA